MNPQSIDTDGGAFTLTHSGAITLTGTVDASGGLGTISLDGDSTVDIDNTLTAGTGGFSIDNGAGTVSLNGAITTGLGGNLNFGSNPVVVESSKTIEVVALAILVLVAH